MTNINTDMRRWQKRVFGTIWITYFMFYFCRYNLPIAKSSLCAAYNWDAADIGIIFTALTLMYAAGQFVNGQLGDRFGTRIISSIGVAGSVLMNLLVFLCVMTASDNGFIMKHLLFLVAVFWGINGFFQAMGWSPMVRAMTHWFPISVRGKTMGMLGTCYQMGACIGQLLAIFIVTKYVSYFSGDWRMVFLVPAVLFAGIGIFFFFSIRNKPEDVGLPPVDEPLGKVAATSKPRSIFENVAATLKNPYIWIVACTFFLLDVNRYGFVNWLPGYVTDAHAATGETMSAGFLKKVMKICIHPLAGSFGVIVCGWATDKFFQGRRAPVIALTLLCLGASSILFPYVDTSNTMLLVFVVALIGFFTYGAHILMVGHAAQDFGHKEGAAGAAGFIDCMGYIGASFAGWGAGKLIVHFNKADALSLHGYKVTFILSGICALIGAALICTIWKLKPEHNDK